MLATTPMGASTTTHCIGTKGTKTATAPGTALEVYPCNHSPAQQFNRASTKSGAGYTYTAGAEGTLCMDFAKYKPKTAVQLAPCVAGKASQQFNNFGAANNTLLLQAINPVTPSGNTLCIAVSGKKLVLATCYSSSPAQAFYGYFILEEGRWPWPGQIRDDRGPHR